jgi:hypothetical protein
MKPKTMMIEREGQLYISYHEHENRLRDWLEHKGELYKELSDLTKKVERLEKLERWLDKLPDPHLPRCAIHGPGKTWLDCDCGCKEAIGDVQGG